MIRTLLLTLFILPFYTGYAQYALPDQQYKLIAGSNSIQSKNYYLLTLFQQDPNVRSLIQSDAALSKITKDKLGQVEVALKECKTTSSCFTEAMKFSPEEIDAVSQRLSGLYADDNAFGKLMKKHVVPSGTYIRFRDLSYRQQLVKAWEQDAGGINFAIGVYGEGRKPNYPNIDSISFNVKDSRFQNLLYTFSYGLYNDCKDSALFFIPSLKAALRLLEINDSENAGDYEPMSTTVNKAAVDRIKNIQWQKYPYTLILVPGAGPDDKDVELSAEAMLRMRIAALQYSKGLAPFIVVSGGKVHPYKTRFCEADKMKQFLLQKLKIPEYAVIMEPHARHTTTNLRNCARLIFRYGMPFDKPCLTSTSRGQSMAISTTLADRCMRELQEVPFRVGKRLSETEVEFYPLAAALHINPLEPLDP